MKIIKLLYTLTTTLIVCTSCSKYLDINDNPNKPTTAELNKVLTGAEYDIAMSLQLAAISVHHYLLMFFI